MLAILRDSTSQIISLKLCRLKLYPIHRYDPWRFTMPTHDESSMLDVMTMIARMTNLCRLHITCGKLEDHHISVLHPICPQLEELELRGELVHWIGPQSLLNNASISFIANCCRKPKVLDISVNRKLTSVGVNKVLENCLKLELITLSGTTIKVSELKNNPIGFPLLEIIKKWDAHS